MAALPLRLGVVRGVGHPKRQGLLGVGRQGVSAGQNVGVDRTVKVGVDRQVTLRLQVADLRNRKAGELELVGDLEVFLVDGHRGAGRKVVRCVGSGRGDLGIQGGLARQVVHHGELVVDRDGAIGVPDRRGGHF